MHRSFNYRIGLRECLRDRNKAIKFLKRAIDRDEFLLALYDVALAWGVIK